MLRDGLLDQRVAVAGGQERRGRVVAVDDLAPLVEDHDAVGDGAQRPRQAVLGARHP